MIVYSNVENFMKEWLFNTDPVSLEEAKALELKYFANLFTQRAELVPNWACYLNPTRDQDVCYDFQVVDDTMVAFVLVRKDPTMTGGRSLVMPRVLTKETLPEFVKFHDNVDLKLLDHLSEFNLHLMDFSPGSAHWEGRTGPNQMVGLTLFFSEDWEAPTHFEFEVYDEPDLDEEE